MNKTDPNKFIWHQVLTKMYYIVPQVLNIITYASIEMLKFHDIYPSRDKSQLDMSEQDRFPFLTTKLKLFHPCAVTLFYNKTL